MNPKLIDSYRTELQHLRDSAAEFARRYPKVAGRLSLAGDASQGECADPYVERLLEGVAFLAARVQVKMDAEHEIFTQHVLDMICPGYAAPVPSMVVVRMDPDDGATSLQKGVVLPRGTSLSTKIPSGSKTPCRFRTAQEITLWPIRIAAARYQGGQISQPRPSQPGVKILSNVRIDFAITAGSMGDLENLDRLDIYLPGNDASGALYELLLTNCVSIFGMLPGSKEEVVVLDAAAVTEVGFDDDEAVLPIPDRGFAAYRLLKEYSVFADRFRFVRVSGLQALMRKGGARQSFSLSFNCNREQRALERAVDATNFALYCAPAINLFKKFMERIYLKDSGYEFNVVADRVRPTDFEIHSILSVDGYSANGLGEPRRFHDLYTQFDAMRPSGYYSFRREQRLSGSDASHGRNPQAHSEYVASEIYLSLADLGSATDGSAIGQLAVEALCSNRERPLAVISGGKEDFKLEVSAPVSGIRCVAGPTRPVPAGAGGSLSWRLISQLGINYLSLLDCTDGEGARALREMLYLFGLDATSPYRKQIDGVKAIKATRITRRLPSSGPICFGLGVGVELEVDEQHFDGTGILIFGALMDRFFARYASVNSFTQFTLRESKRGEIRQWIPRAGRRMTF